MVRRRRRRLKVGRIIFALVVVAALICGIVFGISALFKNDKSIEIDYPSFPSFENYGYKLVNMPESDVHKGLLTLVNYDHHYVTDAPDDLVTVASKRTKNYAVKDDSLQVRDLIMPSLNSMMDDFVSATGLKNVVVISGHRTVEYQQTLYDNDLERTGKDYSDEVARPGESEHHTGLTFDLAIMENDTSKFFDGSGEYSWMHENCENYGFVIRYPEEKEDITKIIHEPWHYRYVGNVHAKVMTENNLCLEEYIDFLKKHPYDGEHLEVTVDEKNYAVYYVASTGEYTQVYVPLNEPYTVSGNNVDGFIVTVELEQDESVSEEISEE